MIGHVAHILPAINPKIPIELYEYDHAKETLQKVSPSSLTSLSSWLVPLRETQLLLDSARAEVERVTSLAPSRITLHPAVPARQIVLRFHGLSFARWEDRKIVFGIPGARQELMPKTHGGLKQLLHGLEAHRNPLALDTMHSLFRAQPERWLETHVRQDVTRVDAALDPSFVCHFPESRRRR